MKKILLSMLLLVSMTMFAQSEAVRKMNLVYDGQVVYSRSVSLIDSIKFVWEETGDDVIGGGEVDGTKQLYVGVVAFNQNVGSYSNFVQEKCQCARINSPINTTCLFALTV